MRLLVDLLRASRIAVKFEYLKRTMRTEISRTVVVVVVVVVTVCGRHRSVRRQSSVPVGAGGRHGAAELRDRVQRATCRRQLDSRRRRVDDRASGGRRVRVSPGRGRVRPPQRVPRPRRRGPARRRPLRVSCRQSAVWTSGSQSRGLRQRHR